MPAWFYAYALAAGLLAALGLRLTELDHPQRPDWQRVLLRGFGNVLPIVVMLAGRQLLQGDWQKPELVAIYLSLWLVMALICGLFSVWIHKKNKKVSQIVRDWL